MKKMRMRVVCTLLCLLTAAMAFAQGGSESYRDGMSVKLDSSGNKYIRFFSWATFWARYTQANPGTAINGIEKAHYTDFSLRQFRFVTLAQLSPRYLILADIGMDNQSFSTGGIAGGGNTGNGGPEFAGTLGKKAELYVHDLWNEFAILAEKDDKHPQGRKASAYIGTGLHYWNGISRMTSAGSANYLALDVPLYNWPLVDLSDQFARQLGIYLKGNFFRLSYRWAINKPFTVRSNARKFPIDSPDSSFAVDDNATGRLSTTGYVAYQFFQKENNVLPFMTGTYVGTMRVLNLGAGYYFSREGTVTQKSNELNSAFIRHDISLWAMDIFADLPFGGKRKNWAFTGYSAYYHYRMGPNYLRYASILNENVGPSPSFQGQVSQAGFGNAAPVIGTGFSWFTQLGLLLPRKSISQKVRLQAFGEFSLQQFERFGNSDFTYWSAGGNVFLDGHHARISFKYQTRPIVISNAQQGSKGTFIIATQVYL